MRVQNGALKKLAILSLILWLASMTATTSYSQEPVWSKPMRVPDEGRGGWFPDVATDSSGRVHVVWSGGFDDVGETVYDSIMMRYSDDGITWSEPNDIVSFVALGGAREATRPTLFADRQGLMHLTCRWTRVFYSNAHVSMAGVSPAWQPPQRISSGQVAYFSRVAKDSQGTLHLIYTENVPTTTCAVCFHVFYTFSLNDGKNWSDPVDVSVVPNGAAKPQLLIDRQDNLQIVWEEGPGGAYGQVGEPTFVVHVASYDQGRSWATPTKFTRSGSAARNVTIGLDNRNQLIIVWWSIPDDTIYYHLSRDQGRTWTPARPIPDVVGIWAHYHSTLDNYAMAMDSAGNVHLAIIGRLTKEQRPLNVLHLIWNGLAWTKPEVVATYTDDYPEWPRIAVGNGNQLHVVWFVRDGRYLFDSERGRFDVWYARSKTNSPAVPPVVMPTFTPTPAPVAVLTIAPTATPSPPKFPQPPSTVNYETVANELPLMLRIVQGAIPPILLIMVMAIGMRIRRR